MCSQGLGFTSALEASLESFPLPVYFNPIRETLRLREEPEVLNHLMAAFIYRALIGRIILKFLAVSTRLRFIPVTVLLNCQKF